MFDAIKPLLESGLINEDIGAQLNEAWVAKLNEAKEQVRAELREEFAQRYEHDKTIMVEALDKMVTEGLSAEIEEFNAERQAMHEDRVQAKRKLSENVSKFNDFMIKHLAEEIKELRAERQLQLESQQKLEQFIVHALSREIKEFAQDKQAVVEAKVKLVAEGRKQLEALKSKFVTESAKRMNAVITSQLKGELGQLKEDIQAARENDFGRRIFESFATEFSATHLNEKADTRKLVAQLKEKDEQLAEGYAFMKKADFKRVIGFVDDVLASVQQYRSVKKATKKVRAKKPVNKMKLVSRMKYCKEFKDLRIILCPMTRVISESMAGVTFLKHFMLRAKSLLKHTQLQDKINTFKRSITIT